MIAIELLSWWYGHGWKLVLRHAAERLVKVSHMFSVPILLRTLWSPWRRIITYPGASLEAKMRAAGDNFVSRMVGFSVRAMVLFSAGVMLCGTALYSAGLILLWPLVPPSIVGLIILAALA